MSNRQTVFNNFLWLLLNKVINVLVEFISIIIVVRYIGPANNGILNYAISFCALFIAIANMGTTDFVTKEFATEKEPFRIVAGTSLLLITIGSIVSFITCNIIAWLLEHNAYRLYIFILSIQFVFQPLIVFQYWFIGRAKVKYYSITQNVIRIIGLGLRIILVVIGAEFIWFVIATACETILLYLGLFIVYRFSSFHFESISSKFVYLKKYFKICSPLIVSSIASTIYMKFDQIMIGNMLGNVELGIYSVAVKLVEYWYCIPTILYSSFLPAFAKDYSTNISLYKTNLQFFADLLGGISICVAILMTVFSNTIILFLYGDKYLDAAQILSIYCWAGVLVSISFTKLIDCTNRNLTKFQMISTCVGALLNITINYVLIPIIGAKGAALSTVFAQFVSSIGICMLYKPVKELAQTQLIALFPFVRLIKNGKCFLKKLYLQRDR